ncbi:cell wall-binding repeat-containing protein [Homoserinimonas sp. OAct 916]|uniref:cell wall-binding repeat-containing protein n=1 Tax=Homoserinimonas sp. OAct 916 TaxID=2211450 RepID=UPI0018E55943|nr:cell wall-binding repeat-containing protein [Homoserinimonas sp. OAct 916]
MPKDGFRPFPDPRSRHLIVSGAAMLALVMSTIALPAAMAEDDTGAAVASDAVPESTLVTDSAPLFDNVGETGAADDPSSGASDQSENVEIDDASLEAEPKLMVEGTLMVYIVDAGPRIVSSDGGGAASDPVDGGRKYLLVTESGERFDVVGDVPTSVRSGSEFAGTLALPKAVVDAVDSGQAALVEGSADDPVRLDSEAGTQVVEAVVEQDLPLEIAAAEIRTATYAVQPSKAHILDIAVVAPKDSGTSTFISKAQVSGLVAKMSAFWKIESRGGLPTITVRSFKNYSSSKTIAQGGCDAFTLWTEAAAKFGRAQFDYERGTGAEHLVVLSPNQCGGGNGLGTLSAGLHSGGVIWAGLGADTDLQTIGHEFGHNTSLDHSNAHHCPDAAVVEGKYTAATYTFSDDCTDVTYADYFDFMSGGMVLTYNGVPTSNNTLTALNAPDRERLGLYNTGELEPVAQEAGVAASTKTYTINAATVTSGLRALKVKDPKNLETYYVEFRSGSGVDKDALYTQPNIEWAQELGAIDGLGVGVRIVKRRWDNSTAALRAIDIDGEGWRDIFLAEGKSLTSRGGGLMVTASQVDLAADTATVSITLKGMGPAKVDRISGDDRYVTAVEISKAGFAGTAPVVYLATGTNYPDALSAAPAATKKGGPLLLTMPKSLPGPVAAEIKRLKPQKVVVVGGTGAVSNQVMDAVKKLLPAASVKRIGGTDRFDTSRKLIGDAFPSSGTAYVATGMDYPDALSASAAAGAIGAPVVLVNGKAKSLDTGTAALLKKLAVTKVLIAGGTGVLSKGIETGLKAYSPTRFAGNDRFETSQKINKQAFPKAARVFFATGYQFPDALAGAALAGASKAPLYVVQPKCVPAGILTDIKAAGALRVTLLGGTGALSKDVASLKSCG